MERASTDNYKANHCIYICIMLLLITVLPSIYFALFRIPSSKHDDPVVRALRDRFIEQLDYALQNPGKSTLDKVQIPENALFTRTSTVQYLYDYAEAATKHFFQRQYAADPNYRHVRCPTTFSHRTMSKLPKFQMGVKVNTHIFHHTAVSHQLYSGIPEQSKCAVFTRKYPFIHQKS